MDIDINSTISLDGLQQVADNIGQDLYTTLAAIAPQYAQMQVTNCIVLLTVGIILGIMSIVCFRVAKKYKDNESSLFLHLAGILLAVVSLFGLIVTGISLYDWLAWPQAMFFQALIK